MFSLNDTLQEKLEESRKSGLWRPELPRLTEPIRISLAPDDVIAITRITLDQDRDAALEFITDRLEKEIRKITDKIR
ncbi:MAG: hypothetical protein ACP5U1_05110 [Desulfomonilaceae bacterium]